MGKVIRVADLFCGAGGSSTALVQACEANGVRLDLTAVNHWPVAMETLATNHPQASYHFAGNNRDQVKQIGNSVPLRTAGALWAEALSA